MTLPRGAAYAAGLLAGLLGALLIGWFVAGWADVRSRQRGVRDAPRLAAQQRGAQLAHDLRGELGVLLQREVERPYFHYQNLFHDPRASAPSVAPSPLAQGPGDPLVLGHFQVDARRRTITPTINDELPELSEPTRLADNRRFRDEVARSLAGPLTASLAPVVVAQRASAPPASATARAAAPPAPAAPAPPAEPHLAPRVAQDRVSVVQPDATQGSQVLKIDLDSYSQNVMPNSVYIQQRKAPTSEPAAGVRLPPWRPAEPAVASPAGAVAPPGEPSGDTASGDTAPRSTPPGDTASRSTIPGSTPPGDTALRSTPPGDTSRSTIPGSTPPGDTASRSTPPGDTASRSTIPGSTPPGDTALRSTIPGNTPPGDTASRSTIPGSRPPGDTAPGNIIPGNTTPRDPALGDPAPRGPAPRNTTPRNTTPRNTTPRNNTPRNNTPRNNTPRNTTPRNTAPRSTASPIAITVSPLEWRTMPYGGRPTIIAARQVDTPDGVLVQGFVVDRTAVTSWLAGHAGDAVVELRTGDDGSTEIVPGWHLEVAANPRAVVAAVADATRVARSFLIRFVAVGIIAVIAAWLVVLLVARAERLARERSQFAAAAAHELRTPLAGLQLYGDMLADGLGDPAKLRDYARRMSEEAARLGRVVSNVLGFSQLERGNLSLEPRPGAVDEALRELADRAQPALDRAGATLALDVTAGVTARFDRDALSRIIGNLLDNAEKYSRHATDRTIDLTARAAASSVEITVSDHGPGISPSTRARLFQPFARGVTSDGPAGLGLGLALSQSLARAMGGELAYRTAPGGGAAFVLTLVRA